MRLVAVVLNWNGGDDTLAALGSLREVETICVDNGSTDGSAERVAERFPEVELLRTGDNLGFSGGNNVGIRRALERDADWVLLLNNDAVADPALPAALEAAARQRPDAGVLACKVYFAEPPDTLMYAGGSVRLRLGYWGRQDGFGERDDGSFDRVRDVDRATGAAMAVSREALVRAGLLDEQLFAYAEDAEWCLRIARAGLAVVFVPGATVRHVGSASTGGLRSPTSLYYDTRNMIVVCERFARLPPGLRALRRLVIVSAHLLNARSGTAVAAVLSGWRDARRGRLGRR
jgi:GT2 family glycosyltransferase